MTGDDAPIVRRRFGIEPDGNAPQDPQGEFTGRNLLYIAQPIDDVAARTGQTPEAIVDALGRARAKLFAVRERRPRPHLDDKVLTAWNGLMIARVRARRARARREPHRAAVSRGRTPRRGVHPPDAVDEARAASAAPLPRRGRRHRRLRRGLRLPDLRAARALSGRRRSRVARVGDGAAGRAGSPVLGRGGGRVVQHDRERSQRAAAAQGGLRRRRARGRFGLGAESAHARVAHRRRRLDRERPSARWRGSARGSAPSPESSR